jgi:hypothetical protein
MLGFVTAGDLTGARATLKRTRQAWRHLRRHRQPPRIAAALGGVPAGAILVGEQDELALRVYEPPVAAEVVVGSGESVDEAVRVVLAALPR